MIDTGIAFTPGVSCRRARIGDAASVDALPAG
jgi:hypothetical protein